MLSPVAWNTSYPRPCNGGPYSTSDTGTGLAPNFFALGTSAGVGFQSGDGLGGAPTDGVDRVEDFDGVDDIIEDGLSAFSPSNPYPNLRDIESQPADSGAGVDLLTLPTHILGESNITYLLEPYGITKGGSTGH